MAQLIDWSSEDCSYLTIARAWFVFLFFFQAEDGIRDLTVTGVQTCALPISSPVQLAFIRECFTKIFANSAINKSVIVGAAPRDFSISWLIRFWAAISSPQSTYRTRKKCGTLVQLCVVRSAISRATWLSGSTPAGAGAAAPFPSAKLCTSSDVIVPSGPVPRI